MIMKSIQQVKWMSHTEAVVIKKSLLASMI